MCTWSTTIGQTFDVPSFSELSDAVGYCCVRMNMKWNPDYTLPHCPFESEFVDTARERGAQGRSPSCATRICRCSYANNCTFESMTGRRAKPSSVRREHVETGQEGKGLQGLDRWGMSQNQFPSCPVVVDRWGITGNYSFLFLHLTGSCTGLGQMEKEVLRGFRRWSPRGTY